MTTAKEQKYASKTGTGTLEWPRYSPGLLLEDDDLTSAVKYTQDMMRLMFRSLFGCGVICGLDVSAQLTCNRSHVDVSIAKGVALDCLGHPIELPKGETITYSSDCDTMPEWLWVVVCYRESCCRPKDVSCSPDDQGQVVQTRGRDGYEVRLYPYWPKCICSCEPPPEGKTKTKGDCCDDEAETATTSSSAAARKTPSGSTARLTKKSSPRTPVAINEGPGNQYDDDDEESDKPTLPPLCDCYQEHYDGKCSCDCCCPCVLVGKIHTVKTTDDKDIDLKTDDPQALKVERDWVRWIRPVLVGYYKCIKAMSGTVSGGTGTTTTKGPHP